jgi:hypothetical protein
MSEKLTKKIMDTCPYEQLVGYNGVKVTDADCQALLDKAETQIGGYFEYALYDECWYQNDLIPPTRGFDQTGRKYWGPPPYPKTENLASMLQGAKIEGNDYPCGGPTAVFTWVDNA